MGRLLPCLALLALASLLAGAADRRVSIASGVSGGTYRGVYARDLETRLDDFTVIHRLSSGSGENLEMLADGRAEFAFVQADVYAARLWLDAERFGGFTTLGRLGTECLFVATRKDGPIDRVAGLAQPIDGRWPEVAVGPPSAGSSGTWAYLVYLGPELENTIAHPVGDRVALRFLERGTFDAVLWVTDPSNYDHRMLQAVRSSGSIRLVGVEGEVFTATLPDGSRVYEIGSVRIARGTPPIRTICTSALLLAGRDVDPKLIERARRMRGLRRSE